MTEPVTTLGGLLSLLDSVDASTPAVFSTDSGEIGAGYHVTEFKLADMRGIDCGRRLAHWTEASMQLLDADGGSHMLAGRLGKIARQSVEALAGLADAPLTVEFAPRNRGLRRYSIGDVVAGPDGLRIGLLEDRAICKPGIDAIANGRGVCCGPSASPDAACCG